ncbi:molybdopterin cofactor-binding domain-containing protein [Streptomyces sp. NPDC021212]|uniref:molybdopterin cofactor-binding domain-containing protein n=1 Tax=Streptomyces sp. NPDC021212 TaxID=3365118 RepID=UPI0037A84FB2
MNASAGYPTGRAGGPLGESVPRPDGPAKTDGTFVYSSDLRAPEMLWGATTRSPHPHARILRIDTEEARALPGVHAVLTHRDVPGRNLQGSMVVDKPVLAVDVVRYEGEAVALVAADHRETARRAAALVRVEYEVLHPLTDPAAALDEDAVRVHPEGNLVRRVPLLRGAAQHGRLPRAEVVVRGEYEIGMQDQAFLSPESGLAVPTADGGVDLHVASQWIHEDHAQVAASLGLPGERVRVLLAGVGGAFGGREDLSMHVHASMLALRTGRPVKMCYSREESFFGHVHRHPARMAYEHGATRDGKLVYVKASILLDGGAYASTSTAITSTVAMCAAGPYEVEHVDVEVRSVYTHNPPCGAMRGFGAVQACYGYESQMDLLAAKLGLDPVELRLRNAVAEGSTVANGQVLDQPAPIAELLHRLRAVPLPGPAQPPHPHVQRGVGYAVGLKNVGFIEGFDDYSTARVRLELHGGVPRARVTTAAAEVGQGLVTVQSQIVTAELGVSEVLVELGDTAFGDAGPTSSARQSYVTGGAVKAAAEAVRALVLARTDRLLGTPGAAAGLERATVVDAAGRPLAKLADILAEGPVEETREFHHRPTRPLDPVTGQGDAIFQFAFAAHRAVVDVDMELGTVEVVALDTTQDVGLALNPLALRGQLHGGSCQGLGLALMEEIQVSGGRISNPSFTDYLIPTMTDIPRMRLEILEHSDPHAPYGLRGAGEMPTVTSTSAVAAAVRAATGRTLPRIPIGPEDILGLS